MLKRFYLPRIIWIENSCLTKTIDVPLQLQHVFLSNLKHSSESCYLQNSKNVDSLWLKGKKVCWEFSLVLGIILCALDGLTHLTLTIILLGRYYYLPFKDEKTDTEN